MKMPLSVNQTSLRRIVLSDALPREGSGMLVHYEHEPVSVIDWLYCDVREVVALNEDRWLSEIEAWHRDLSERATDVTKWWPLLPESRLILWQNVTLFELKPILFTLGVMELCTRQSNSTVWIVGAPDDVVGYLSEWDKQGQSVLIERRGAQTTRWNGAGIVETFSFWLKLVKQSVSISGHCAFRKRILIQPAKVIVNSLVLNPKLLRIKGDHFFGQMIDRIDDLSDKNTVWIYLDSRLANRETRSELVSIKRRAYFMPDFFRWSDLWFAMRTASNVWRALKPIQASCPPLHVGDLVSPSFSANFLSSLVTHSPPIFELVLYKQWGRILKESEADTVIYPYEEKPLEHAMLLAVRDFAPRVRTIGFAHAAYSKGHLYLRRGCHGEPPRPDIVATTGEIGRKLFEMVGVPSDQICVIGSPRFCSEERGDKSIKSKRRPQILLLIGYGFELRNFASIVENRPDLFAKYDLVIRRYPYSWFDEQDLAEARLNAAGIVYRSDASDLISQIDKSDIVLFESTSAGMEASLRGKLVIHLNLSDIMSTNHFYSEHSHEEIKFCRDADELKRQLKYIASLTPEQYAMTAERQRRLVVRLYSPVDLSVLRSLLEYNPP